MWIRSNNKKSTFNTAKEDFNYNDIIIEKNAESKILDKVNNINIENEFKKKLTVSSLNSIDNWENYGIKEKKSNENKFNKKNFGPQLTVNEKIETIKKLNCIREKKFTKEIKTVEKEVKNNNNNNSKRGLTHFLKDLQIEQKEFKFISDNVIKNCEDLLIKNTLNDVRTNSSTSISDKINFENDLPTKTSNWNIKR